MSKYHDDLVLHDIEDTVSCRRCWIFVAPDGRNSIVIASSPYPSSSKDRKNDAKVHQRLRSKNCVSQAVTKAACPVHPRKQSTRQGVTDLTFLSKKQRDEMPPAHTGCFKGNRSRHNSQRTTWVPACYPEPAGPARNIQAGVERKEGKSVMWA